MIERRWKANPKLLNIEKTPLGISGFLLELIKDYFRFQKTYSDNPIESKLLIDLHQQWNPSNCENYPGLYVKRNAWAMRTEGKVIGDQRNFLMSEDGYSYEFWMPITASYSIICIGKEYGELEVLLNEMFIFLSNFSEPIARVFELAKFEVTQLSGVNLLQEEKNYRSGQVDLMMIFDYIWKLTVEKALIKDINNDIQ